MTYPDHTLVSHKTMYALKCKLLTINFVPRHFTGTNDQWNKDENRSLVIKYINENKMAGYLAFHDNKPVGWCNANNRLNYKRLLKYYDLIDNP
jgi:hypothetical protein